MAGPAHLAGDRTCQARFPQAGVGADQDWRGAFGGPANGRRPRLLQPRQLIVPLDERGGPRLVARPGPEPTHTEVGEGLVDALDRLRLARLDIEPLRDQAV